MVFGQSSIHTATSEQNHFLNGACNHPVAELQTQSTRCNDVGLDHTSAPRATSNRRRATIESLLREPSSRDFILPMRLDAYSIG